MFKEVNKIYDYHKRKNYFFSYLFLSYKLCGLLGIRDYNPKLQKTHRKDEIVWEKICKELNWTLWSFFHANLYIFYNNLFYTYQLMDKYQQ